VALTRLSARDMREDLVFLRDEWARGDSSFGPKEARTFRALVTEAIGDVDHLDPLDFWMRVSRAVALARNGHTNVNADEPPFPGLPFRAWWFKDGLFIVEAERSHSSLLGARIERVGNASPRQALSAVAPYISGNGQRIRCVSPRFLRIPGLLHRLGLTDHDREVRFKLRRAEGGTYDVTVPLSRSKDPRRGEAEDWAVLIPSRSAQPRRWVHVLDKLPVRPWTYQPAVDVESRWLSKNRETLYIRSNHLNGPDGDELSLTWKLLGIIIAEVVPNRPRAAIVDLRFNSGGNFGHALLFAQALPKLLARGGRVIVLVGPSTFSAAIVAAALLKNSGGPMVRILGTKMGDNERFWAEGSRVALPHSGLRITPSAGFQDWAKGGADPGKYFWANVVWGPKTRISLRPEVVVEPTYAEYASGRDPALEAALVLSA
jgi:hypothetical protein